MPFKTNSQSKSPFTISKPIHKSSLTHQINQSTLYFDHLGSLDLFFKNNLIKSLNQNHQSNQNLTNQSNQSRIIIAHDFKGGYNDLPSDQRAYTFEWFSYIDTFVYFSHHRITIPPPDWITAAKTHHTSILGTLIFEHKTSLSDLELLLTGPKNSSIPTRQYFINLKPIKAYEPLNQISTYYADRLIDLALYFGFDGWLLNFEIDLITSLDLQSNSLSGQIAKAIRIWVEYLRLEGIKRVGSSWEVSWYDSLSYENGSCKWRSSLDNKDNLFYYAAATSIFLDYHWNSNSPNQTLSILSKLQETINSKPSNEEKSLTINLSNDILKSFENKGKNRIENLKTDVYFGVDVFGRGCMYGGGFSSWKAIELIQTQYDFSIALFAPGWTWESHHLDLIRLKSKDWWKSWWEEERFQWVGISELKAKSLENSFVDGCRISKEAKETVLPKRGTSYSEFPQHLPISKFFNPLNRSLKLDVPNWFYTNYSLGSGGNGFWIEGFNCLEDQKTWTDMSFCFPKNDLSINDQSRREDGNQPFVKRLGSLVCCENVEDVGWFGSGSVKIEDQEIEEEQLKGSVGLVWMNTLPVKINGGVECRMVWKSNEIESKANVPLGIVLDIGLIKNDGKLDRKIGFECYESLVELIGFGIDLVKVKDIQIKKLKHGWNETSCKLISQKSDLLYIKRFGVMVQSGKFKHHLGEVAIWPIFNSTIKEKEEIIEVEFDQVHGILKWIHEPNPNLIVIQFLVYLVLEESLNRIENEIFLGNIRDRFFNVNQNEIENERVKRLYQFEVQNYLKQIENLNHGQHKEKKWVNLKRVEIDGSLKFIKKIEL